MNDGPEKQGVSLPPADDEKNNGKKDVASKVRPQREANFHDYLVRFSIHDKYGTLISDSVFLQRVFKYASKWDFVAYALGSLASVGAGITLPLLNVVFGTILPFTSLAAHH